VTAESGQTMDPTNFQAIQKTVMNFHDCLVEKAGPWVRVRVAGEIMDMLGVNPVHVSRFRLAELWEGAKVVHHATMAEIFGLEPAQVAAMFASTYVSRFASPVS